MFLKEIMLQALYFTLGFYVIQSWKLGIVIDSKFEVLSVFKCQVVFLGHVRSIRT
jgi:hypothetical protein